MDNTLAVVAAPSTRPPRRGFALGLGMLVLILLISACARKQTDGPKAGDFGSGSNMITKVAPKDRQSAPKIAGEDLDGKPVSLAQFKGKVVVVNIWGSWCPPCRKETPALIEVSKAMKPKGVQFLGIAIREGQASSKAYARRTKMPYPSITNESGSQLVGFSKSLPSVAVPTTYVIDRQGRVAVRLLAVATVPTLTGLVTDVLEGR